MITVTTPCQEVKPNTFMIEGKPVTGHQHLKYSRGGELQVIKRNQYDVFCRSICFLERDANRYFGCTELPLLPSLWLRGVYVTFPLVALVARQADQPHHRVMPGQDGVS